MDLETLVRREGPIPQKRVIHILRQVCESLEEAHAAGLVHRDIKPANIHVGRVGLQHDFVKVLDFGLVKSVLPQSDDAMATARRNHPGTPAYLAPEMALGETPDGRADLYAPRLCRLFPAYRAVGVPGRERAADDHQAHPGEAGATLAAHRAGCCPELDRVVLACLAKKPEDRPRSAAELERMLGELEVEPWTEEAATQWWQTHQPA